MQVTNLDFKDYFIRSLAVSLKAQAKNKDDVDQNNIYSEHKHH